MLNKNFIIGAIVVVLLGSGVTFYFLNGSNNTNTSTNAPSSVSRTGEFTRELAKQIIVEFYAEQIETEPDTVVAAYNDVAGGYNMLTVPKDKVDQLAAKGLITKLNSWADDGYSTNYFVFTDAAAPYLSGPAASWENQKNKTIKLSDYKLKDITITGITKESETKALVYFDVEGEYTYTSFGEVLSEKQPSKQSSPIGLPFVLFDDGWRIQLGL